MRLRRRASSGPELVLRPAAATPAPASPPPPPARRRRLPGVRQRAGILAAALALAGVLALAVFPAQAYLAQRRHHDELTNQVADLAATNQDLRDRAAQLQTDEEIERLARLQYHLVRPGEEAYVILPDDTPPATAPPAPEATPEPDGNWFSRAWSRVTSLF